MIPHSRPTINEQDVKAVAGAIRSGQIAQGPKVEKFEKAMASYIGLKGAVALNSGTAALHLSLLCLGVKEGDEVIIPSYACTAILNSIYYVGAIPRLIDIEKNSYNLDPSLVEGYLRNRDRRKKIKAIIIVHTFGQPADITAFLAISKKYDVPIIEDFTQALGATFKGKRIGSFGCISILSLYATKVMTTGEGGMILSDKDDVLEKMKDIREYDERDHFKLRYNYKMTDMAASLGINQLKKLPSFIKRRKEIADIYDSALSKLDNRKFDIESRRGKGKGRIYYRYVFESDHTDEFIMLMEKFGVSCRRPVFSPIHHYTGEKGFPQSEMAWQRTVSIPIYPDLTSEEVQKITDSLIKAGETR